MLIQSKHFIFTFLDGRNSSSDVHPVMRRVNIRIKIAIPSKCWVSWISCTWRQVVKSQINEYNTILSWALKNKEADRFDDLLQSVKECLGDRAVSCNCQLSDVSLSPWYETFSSTLKWRNLWWHYHLGTVRTSHPTTEIARLCHFVIAFLEAHVHCTSSGCRKREAHINWSMGFPE